MKLNTQYGYPISSIFFQICGMIFLILLAILSIASGIFLATISIILIIIFFWYVVIYQFKKRFLQLRKDILNQMIRYAQLIGNENILDLGTGAGYIAIGFSKVLEYGRVVGVDKYDQRTRVFGTNFFEGLKINFFKNKLNRAKRNASLEHQLNHILFVKSDLQKQFPFSHHSFDLVLSSQFLYCIPSKHLHQVLSEVDRVVKPSGQLIFFESKKFFQWNILQVKSFFEKIGYHTQIYTLKNMSNKCIFIARKIDK